jgi:integrase
MNKKNGEETRFLSHFSKTDFRYWNEAVFRKGYTKGGRQLFTKEWYARMQHDGRREFFPLQTANRAAAASRARDIYLHLISHGWGPTITKYKPKLLQAQAVSDKLPQCTVGTFLEEVFRSTSNRRTVEGYATAFRTIVSDSFGLSSDQKKYDSYHGGRAEWLNRVHSIPLDEVTTARIQKWKQSFLAKAGSEPLALRKARISVNSLMRRARSLFSPKILRHLQLEIPPVNPFNGVDFEPRQSMKYRSRLDIGKIIEAANEGLRSSDPECHAIFLLAVAAGLRRKEIDLLEWTSFRWEENVIRIQPTHFFHPKSEDSIGDIQIDDEIVEIFREYRAMVKGPFVIPSALQPKAVLRGDYYRCKTQFERLNSWLRLQGVTEQKPLHTLRKEFGTLVNVAHGIHAASKALRHADITLTNNFYADSRIRVTPGLGRLFKSPPDR